MKQITICCCNCVSLVWIVLLLVVVNGQSSSSSLILSNLEDTTTTSTAANVTDSAQSAGQTVIAECQLLSSAMESICEVTSLQGLIQQSQEKIQNCCNLASQIIENDCYDPCEESQTINLWTKSICQLNITVECESNSQIQTSDDDNIGGSLEFRAAAIDEQYQGFEPITTTNQDDAAAAAQTGGFSSTLELGYTDTAEDFAMQLEQAVDAFQSTLADSKQQQNSQTSTVVLDFVVDEQQQVPQILQGLANVEKVSISYELFRKVPEIVDELNSEKSLTLLVPVNDAWESFAVQQGKSVEQVQDDLELVKSVLFNTIGWGMSQFGVLERQQDALLLTLGGSQLTVSRSALSGSIVVRGCCDVENTAKVTDVDFVVDPTFAVHLINRIVLSEAAFKIIQGASGVSVSPFTFPLSSSSFNTLPAEASSPVAVPPLVTQNNNIDDSDNTATTEAPMSLQELRDLVSNLPSNLEIPQDFIPSLSPSPSTTPSQPSPSVSISPTIQSSATTLSQITQQIEEAQSSDQTVSTLRLGQQQQDQQQQLLQKVEFGSVPSVEQQLNDSAAQLVLQQIVTGNVFDEAPVGVPVSASQNVEYEDSVNDELPADILEIMAKVGNNKCDNVSEVLANDPELNNFQVILQETDLMRVLDDLSDELQFTLFAPNNEGFEKLIAEGGPSVEPTLANSTFMEYILSYHVIPNQVFLAGVTSGTILQTTLEQGNEPLHVTIKSYGSSLTVIEGVGSNAVVKKTLEACNVVIHVTDTVLLPFT